MQNNSVILTMSGNKPASGRDENDFYSTPYCATQALLDSLPNGEPYINRTILEPMCGAGHISNVLRKNGYTVVEQDLIARPNIETGELCNTGDFYMIDKWEGNIISNPPYKEALPIIKHALDIVPDGYLVCMLLRLQFLEGQERGEFFKQYPLRDVYVFSKRVGCCKGGTTKDNVSSAQAFAWFVWEKNKRSIAGGPVLHWITELNENK